MDTFVQGKTAFNNRELDTAIRLFTQVPENDPHYRDAREFLVTALTRTGRYDEAAACLKRSHLPPDTHSQLDSMINEDRKMYDELENQMSFFAKQIKKGSKTPGMRDTKKLAKMCMDLVLSPNVPVPLRIHCAKILKDPDIIEQNIDNITRLARSESVHEKQMAFRLFRNHLDKTLQKQGLSTIDDKWPLNKTIRIFETWMHSIIASGSETMKYQVIDLASRFRNRTVLEILAPLFGQYNNGVIKKTISALTKFHDVDFILNRYDKAAVNERRNIVDLARRRPVSESGKLLKKALKDTDWVVRWYANDGIITGEIQKDSGHKLKRSMQKTNRTVSLHSYEHAPASPVRHCENKNVILVSIDMLRADRLGCYGFPERTSPYIDLFAKQEQQFTEIMSNSSWTLPSHVSMLTSTYPVSHGVTKPNDRIPHQTVSLAEIMHENNYLTLALVSNLFVSTNYGFEQGFDVFEYHERQFAEISMDYLIRWIRWHREQCIAGTLDKPFFFFLHMNDVHGPFDESFAPYNEMLPHVYDRVSFKEDIVKIYHKGNVPKIYQMYHSMIYYVDKQLGKLLGELKSSYPEEEFVVVITSDHGEAWGEHDYFTHGFKGYDEELHVPFLAHFPELHSPNRISYIPVQSIDIAPTILGNLGLAIPDTFKGQDLYTSLFSPGTQFYRADILSETTANEGLYKTLYSDNYKYLIHLSPDETQLLYEKLYDVSVDPGEDHPLPEDQSELYDRMRKKLEQMLSEQETGTPASKQQSFLDDDDIRALKAMGYLQ